jgi:methylated-DNA-[protein]-cysteine S-methyltransferase
MGKPAVKFDIFDSPLGKLYLTFSGRHLSCLSFDKPVDIPYIKGTAPEGLINELQSYFGGIETTFNPRLRFLKGTEFEKKVWACLLEIPYGETRSYGWIAEKIGKPAATRAVGRALSRNPVPIILPCHRVVDSDGSIGGYSSGIQKKRRLLELEYYTKLNQDKD